MMVQMERKQWQGWAHRKSSGTPFPVFQQLWDNGCRGGRDKGTCERKRKKKSFLCWFIYDARKVSWTHQNMQQWSYCQRRWSVFIVDWANEWGKKEGERKWEREGRAAILHKGVNHLIFTAPSHSPQNGYFVPSCSQRHGREVGVGVGGVEDTSISSHLCPLLLHSGSASSHIHIHLSAT